MIRPRHLVFGGLVLVIVVGAARLLTRDQRAEVEAPPPLTTAATESPVAPAIAQGSRSAPATPAPLAVPVAADDVTRASALVTRLAALLAANRALSPADEAEIQAIEAQLVALGTAAVAPVLARLDGGGVAASDRERLFNLLRRLPGDRVEERLVVEARSGPQETLRTMAIESLAARKSDRALETLSVIARTDPKLPARPLITAPRSPDDTGTELPDEEVFTPRMQAMAALASTKDPRAVPVLTEVVRAGPDESLRMEAARNLEGLRTDPRAAETLRAAASNDPSPYVRLAALHSLAGSTDPALASVLETIAARDRDAGVRALAGQVLAGLAR